MAEPMDIDEFTALRSPDLFRTDDFGNGCGERKQPCPGITSSRLIQVKALTARARDHAHRP